MRLTPLILACAILLQPALASGADTPAGQATAVGDLASLLEGVFTTQPTAAAPGAPPTPLFNMAKRVEVPALGRNVLYVELRQGSPDGQLLRQRLYVLKQDPDTPRIVMSAYDLGHVPQLAGAYADPTPLAKLDLPDVKPQPAGCEVFWHRTDAGFEGEITAGRCSIDHGENGQAGSVSAKLTVSRTGMSQGSQDASGGKPIVFRRLR